MNKANLPVSSREYKVMFKPKEFVDINKGIEKVVETVASRINKQGGIFKEERKAEKKKTWYLDTNRHELKSNGFLFRVREEHDEYDITLKNRYPDRYIAASYDLSGPTLHEKIKLKEVKFEEDITTPFRSKFSASARFEVKREPKFDTYQDILSIYPGLKRMDISPSEGLFTVNGFVAKEISYDLGRIKFEDEDKAKTGISLWYLPSTEIPVIVEFDIDIRANEVPNNSKMMLEEFPFSLTYEVYNFYTAMQGDSISDADALTTKTEYAYNYAHHKS
jgi:hypothetical protein